MARAKDQGGRDFEPAAEGNCRPARRKAPRAGAVSDVGRAAKSFPQRQAAGPWNRVELRAVAEGLRSIGQRLRVVAESLTEGRLSESKGRAKSRLKIVDEMLWSFAGELFGAQARLRWIGEGLQRAHRRAETLRDDEDLDESTKLVATIECVLVDRLDPAIAALLEAAGYGARDGGPEGEAGGEGHLPCT